MDGMRAAMTDDNGQIALDDSFQLPNEKYKRGKNNGKDAEQPKSIEIIVPSPPYSPRVEF